MIPDQRQFQPCQWLTWHSVTRWPLRVATLMVAALVVWVFLTTPDQSPRLIIGEPQSTNNFVVCFPVINHHSHPLQCYVKVEAKTGLEWPMAFAPLGTPLLDVSSSMVVAPGQTSIVRALKPVKEGPWRLRIVYRETETARDRFIQSYGAAMDDAGWGTLANKIAEGEACYEVFGREMTK